MDKRRFSSDSKMFSGGGVETMGASPIGSSGSRKKACIKILEQPASKALRFRYECEGRSAGSIPGVNSTAEIKTFPSIKIEGYKGRAVVMVSCVTKDPPYRPHPHNLVGKEACQQGVCAVKVDPESMTVTFANLGIQCVKKKDIEEALRVRQTNRVDPYGTGFSHSAHPSSIDLNAVRLCFQVFLEGSEKGKYTIPLTPVVSDPIYDKKAISDLVICKLSDCCCSVAGGKELILLCEKVAKDDIQVRFFEEQDGQMIWEGFGEFQPTQVHKQVAISFRAPQYRLQEVEQPVKVCIQLFRPSDGATSDALPFEYLPLDSDPKLKRKRIYAHDSGVRVLSHLQAEAEKNGAARFQSMTHHLHGIKAEPIEQGPSLYQLNPPGSGIPASDFPPVYRVGRGAPSPQSAFLGPYRRQLSPGRTPTPMEYAPAPESMKYNIPPVHHAQMQHHHQFHAPSQFQSAQYHQYTIQQQMMMNRARTEQTESLVFPLVNPGIENAASANIEGPAAGASSLMNLDSRQCSSELTSLLKQVDSTDLVKFSTFADNLSENLSSNLSLSDIRVPQAERVRTSGTEGDGGSGNNMTDSFTRLTKSTIQELCTLNDMYNP